MKYLVIIYVLASVAVMLYMEDKIVKLQNAPRDVEYKTVYIDQWGNAYDFVKEK